MRHAIRLAPATLFAVLAFSLLACSDDEDETSKQTNPTTPSTDAEKDGGGGSSTSSSKLGTNCTAYVACCEELAEKQPQLASSCDSTKSSLESAADTSTLETSCKAGVDAFKSQGYCK